MVEKTVFVHPQEGILRTLCEMTDTEDPELKIFRFKEWPGNRQSGMRADGSEPIGQVRIIDVFSYWNNDHDIGTIEGSYRVTKKLDAPPEYVAAYEATTKPLPASVAEMESNAAGRCELAIMSALESEERMTLRALKRKISAHRFPQFDAVVQRLSDEGEIQVQADPGHAQRTWVSAKASSLTADR